MVRRYFRFLTDARRSRFWRLIAALLGLIGTGALALAVALLVLIPFTPGTEELKHLKVQYPTVVKSAGGETIAEFGRLNRQWVPLTEIDTTVVQALVSTEDHRFYQHPGVDVKRLVGATARTLMGDLQGGSTLTMQLARNLYPEEIGQSFGPLRKLKEIVTAFKIERAYTKSEIIETYLNTVPFLYGTHGIERGARMYFGTSADALDPEEAAVLVGMLRATAYYNPHRHPERAQQRRNVVLSQMEKRGAITPEEYNRLSSEPLGVDFSLPPTRQKSQAPHFTERLRERLTRWAEERGYNIYTDGLVVHSTLDLDLQKMAEEAVRTQGRALQAVADVEWGRSSPALLSRSVSAYQNTQGQVDAFEHFWEEKTTLVESFIRSTRRFHRLTAGGQSEEAVLETLRGDAAFMDSLRAVKTRLEVGFVGIEPSGAEVRVYVGSRSYGTDQYDHAGIARRQPGSTFKPFVYAAALEEGYDPSDTFEDTPVEIRTAGGDLWRPQNAGGTSTGQEVSLSEGLAQSKNTVTSRLVKEIGARQVARTARQMGVRQSELDVVPSLALGTSSVTLLEMASAYATLARGGRYQEPIFMSNIERRDGQVLETFDPPAHRVISEETAAEITDMMRGVVDHGTGQAIRHTWSVRADVAGKTGTTQGSADGWFLLIHPELVAGAWTGFNDPRVTFRSAHWGQGASNALRVVGDFFRQALRRGALGADRELSPAPEEREDPEEPSLLARAGHLLKSAAQGIGRAAWGTAKSAVRALAGAIHGWLGGSDEAAPPPERRAERIEAPPSRSASDEPPAEAAPRTWNESADERRQRMQRYWEEVQEERQRERERRRERLEETYEEMQEAPPEAPSNTPAAPADTSTEEDRRIGW